MEFDPSKFSVYAQVNMTQRKQTTILRVESELARPLCPFVLTLGPTISPRIEQEVNHMSLVGLLTAFLFLRKSGRCKIFERNFSLGCAAEQCIVQ